jgi:hypothetical protein
MIQSASASIPRSSSRGDGAGGNRTAIVAALGNDVEEDHLESGVGDLRGDARSHDAGAEHRDPIDAHDAASSTVAIP